MQMRLMAEKNLSEQDAFKQVEKNLGPDIKIFEKNLERAIADVNRPAAETIIRMIKKRDEEAKRRFLMKKQALSTQRQRQEGVDDLLNALDPTMREQERLNAMLKEGVSVQQLIGSERKH